MTMTHACYAMPACMQVCDPTTNRRDGSGKMTGVVRAAVENMWNDLKRGHYIDSRSRVLTITLQYAFPLDCLLIAS